MPIDLEGLKASSEILHRILAIPQAADDAGNEAIVGGPVLGFVYVSVRPLGRNGKLILSLA